MWNIIWDLEYDVQVSFSGRFQCLFWSQIDSKIQWGKKYSYPQGKANTHTTMWNYTPI